MVNKENEYDVIVIGGGATGAGTARDCALRGIGESEAERIDRTPLPQASQCRYPRAGRHNLPYRYDIEPRGLRRG